MRAGIARRASELVALWEPDDGNFLASFSSAGESSSAYASPQSALDDVLKAMVYVDIYTKDEKLGLPAGCSSGVCSGTSDPEQLESPWARHSKENIIENLESFQRLFLGGEPGSDGVGFDDFLRARGAGDLADAMTRDIADAITAVAAIDGTMAEALVADLASVEAAYHAVRKVTDSLKGDFVVSLQLRLPGEGAADVD